ALDEAAIEAREPGNFTGVFAGSTTVAARYGRFVPLARIHHLGPLPEPAALAEPGEDAVDQLQGAAARLVKTVTLAPGPRGA
ncbi:MAG TPA: hypothetical protein VFI42_04295, partial [Thermomicrobiaceae bacterium]|nr:hypothetical protein [Thermomicrobiaceae bacterium]